MAAITKYVSLGLTEGALGDVSASSSSLSRDVETTLANNFVNRTQALTSSYELLDLGDVDPTKIYQVEIRFPDDEAATNYVQVASYDGTNTIVFARLMRGDALLLPAEPQSASYPAIRVKMNTGTGTIAIKVIEAGDPTA